MSGGVKSIFKALVGTMTIMIISFFVIEYYNISVASPQIKSMTQVALTQSCQFFAQESYKGNGERGGNAYQIVGYNGFEDSTLNGRFYSTSADTAYNTMYTNSDEFKNYIRNVQMELGNNTWRNLNLLGYAMGIPYSGTLKTGEATLANYYLQDKLTPLNIGVAYLDKPTLTKIFRWELVNILMNGEREMVIPSNTGNSDLNYVLYKGFRVYYNTIRLDDITYKIYNLHNTSQAEEFEKLTNIDVANYLAKSNIGTNDERQYVMVATLNYNMRVGYEGITPIRRAFQWAFNAEMDSPSRSDDVLSNVKGRDASNWENGAVGGETTLSAVGARNEDMVTSGGGTNFNNVSGAYNIDNTIIYYIVR